MDEDDQNSLAGFDLDAWAPPAVAPNFADRVIARVAATDQAIAVEVNRRSARRWWYGTAIAAILAAAAAILVWQMPGRPEPQSAESGSILAVRPQRLVLDHASGDLDVGAYVTWSHVGGVVTVAQRTGAATWHVDANQHLKISLGAATASTQPSIEASDATLRLETNMNLADAKILGATAVTAASLITLIVYEGRVKATSDEGQITVVPSGGVLAIRVDKHSIVISSGSGGYDPNKPSVVMGIGGTVTQRMIVPQTARGDFAEVLLEPGENVTIHDLAATVSVGIKLPPCGNDTVDAAFNVPRGIEHDPYFNPILPSGTYSYTVQCTHGTKSQAGMITVVADGGEELAGTTPGAKRNVVPDVTAVRYDTDTTGTHYLIKRTPKVVSHLPKKLDQNDVRMVMQTAESTLMGRCAIKAKMHLAFTVLASGKVDGLTVTSTDKTGAECIKGIVSMMLFPKAQTGVTVTYPISPAPVCDADSLVEYGTQAEGRGDHASALKEFEKAYACKPDAHTLAVTFMAACNAGKPDSARKLWKVMATETQTHLLQICLHNHITKDILDAP